MRFLIDAQLSPALGEWIVGQGHDADHLADIGLLSAADQTIWERAIADGSVLLTKDRDFAEWATTRRPAPQVVWVRIGNAPTAALITRLQAVWKKVVENLEAGASVVEAGRP